MSRRLTLLATITAGAISVAYAEDGGPGGSSAPVAPGGAGSSGTTPPPGGAKPPQPGFDPSIFIFLIGGLLFMYFFLIRPQRKEEKRRQELVGGMKAGHKVITIGGLHAEVAAVGESTVELKVGDVLMTFNKTAISTNVSLAGDKPAAK